MLLKSNIELHNNAFEVKIIRITRIKLILFASAKLNLLRPKQHNVGVAFKGLEAFWDLTGKEIQALAIAWRNADGNFVVYHRQTNRCKYEATIRDGWPDPHHGYRIPDWEARWSNWSPIQTFSILRSSENASLATYEGKNIRRIESDSMSNQTWRRWNHESPSI